MKSSIIGATTAVVLAVTSAIASAQTSDQTATSTGSQTPATAAATASQQNPLPPAPQKNRYERFGDRLDITGIPAGGLWVRDGKTDLQPGFQAYTPGAALGIKLTNLLAVEGEVAWAVSTNQRLRAHGTEEAFVKTPTLFGYTANVLVDALPADRRVVPYGVAGLGGMFLAERRDLGIDNGSNFFIGNVGAGAKVMFGKWGVRGDYRFFALNAREHDDSFVGSKTRYGNRVYVALIVAPGRDTSGG